MEVLGSIGSANVTTSGISDISLTKVKGPVQVNATDVSKILIEANPDSAESVIIAGTAEDASTVQHAGGRCALSKTNSTSECKQVAAPIIAAMPVMWTSGIAVTDAYSCNGNSGAGGALIGNVCIGRPCQGLAKELGVASRA